MERVGWINDFEEIKISCRRLGFRVTPGLHHRLHPFVFKEGHAVGLPHRTDHGADHVRVFGNGLGWNVDLTTMLGGVRNGGPKNNPIDGRPEGHAHAHRTGFTGRIQRMPTQTQRLELLAGCPENSNFGMAAGITLSGDGIQSTQHKSPGCSLNHVGTKWRLPGSTQVPGSPAGKLAHLLPIKFSNRSSR